MIRVPIPLPRLPYEVLIGKDLLLESGILASEVIPPDRCAVVTDTHVAKHYLEPTLTSLKDAGFKPTAFVIPAGEKSKNMRQVEDLCEQMIAAHLDRKSSLFALGGGVVGDLAGFVAAIFQRGIPCIQLPTTIVAQVDSSVGGKTAVNTALGKNLIGAFHQPRLVIADLNTLETLPNREYWEGFAEIIKHAIIRDAAMLDLLPSDRTIDLTALIARNVAIKAAIVATDEKEECGVRALLNFGHTIGHGIENAAGYGSFLHGEAISLGMVAALWLSVHHADLPESELHRILHILRRFSLPVTLSHQITIDSILTSMEKDKKNEHGVMRFVLTNHLGSAFVSDKVTRKTARQAIEFLRKERI